MPLHKGARGLEDDCAILEVGDETLILTHDTMAEGTHFRSDAEMADVAWKLVAVNLSDLASKGAEPMGVLLSHSLGSGDEEFLRGIREVLEFYSVPLLGGDTIKGNGQRSLGLTAIGKATHTPVPSRGGAKVGDAIYVTGTLGCAMLGFVGNPDHLNAYNRPQPLIDEGRTLAPHVTAIMDISDGLLLDSARMAKASGVCFDIDASSVPVADSERAMECMSWGDDYQLLFTLPTSEQPPVEAERIGAVRPAESEHHLLLNGNPPPQGTRLGYQHGLT